VTDAFDPVLALAPGERAAPILLERQAKRYGDRPLFVAGPTRWSFAQARDQAARYAGRMAASGIKRGDRVALICGNRAEFMSVFLGCAWLGAVSVPINVAARGFQLQHMLSNSGAKLLVIEAEILPALQGIDVSRLALETIWVIGQDFDARAAGFAVPAVQLPAPGEAIEPAQVGPQDPLAILYTSGTTGLSKGVVCPHGQYFWWGIYTGRQLGVAEGDVLHTPLPLFHTNALNCFFQALLSGTTQVVEPRFSVSGYWPAMKMSGATVTYLLGAMVPMLLSRPEQPIERQHAVRVALAPGVPADASDKFYRRTGIVLLEGYGTTESNAVIGSTLDSRKAGWAGRLADGFEALIVDEHDNPLPDGEPGELILRAHEPFAMALGYFGMPDKTVEAWRNLWLHTGDRLVRGPDNFFRFVDRMKDAIRRRGENISSYEVEQVLISHPAVALAAVFPVASDLAEDEVMAAIVLRDGERPREEELIRFCEGKMAYFAVPRFLEFVDELPRTESGKVQKYKLRERGRTPATWDREAAGVVLRR
jgi:carnitine-CoA ligase